VCSSVPHSRSAVNVVRRAELMNANNKDLKGRKVGATAGGNDGEKPARAMEAELGAFATSKDTPATLRCWPTSPSGESMPSSTATINSTKSERIVVGRWESWPVAAGERIERPTRTIRFWFCRKRYPAATGRTDRPFCSPKYPILRRARSRLARIGSARCIERGKDTEARESSHSNLAVQRPTTKDVARDALCSSAGNEKALHLQGLKWWAHQGSNLGPAD
jgi:hypothetical protein